MIIFILAESFRERSLQLQQQQQQRFSIRRQILNLCPKFAIFKSNIRHFAVSVL
jgi:hypothetical protein